MDKQRLFIEGVIVLAIVSLLLMTLSMTRMEPLAKPEPNEFAPEQSKSDECPLLATPKDFDDLCRIELVAVE